MDKWYVELIYDLYHLINNSIIGINVLMIYFIRYTYIWDSGCNYSFQIITILHVCHFFWLNILK